MNRDVHAEELQEQALKLSPEARAALAGPLIESLDEEKDAAEGRFDPLTMVESSAYPPREGLPVVAV